MTSSLVGSEMCIRDRTSSIGPSGGVPPVHLREKNRPSHWTGAACRSRACLLYTSDAADDM
eukprot:12359721-Prorocentrum_lima.AAC.1